MKTAKLKVFKKILKFILLFFLIGSITLAAIAAIFISLYPKEKLLVQIEKRVEAALKRDIAIGNINYSLSGIVLSDTTLYEGTIPQSPVLAKVKKAKLSIALLPLIDKKIHFKEMTLEGLDININYDTNEQSNIEKLLSEIQSGNKEQQTVGDDSSLTTKISTINLIDSNINLENATAILKPLEGSYFVNARIKPGKKTVAINNCTIKLPGKRGVIQPELTINTGDNFAIKGNVKMQNFSLQWVYNWPKKTKPFHIVNGEIKNLHITHDIIEGNVNATSTLSNSPKVISANGHCKVNLKHKTVFLSKTKGKIQTSTFYIQSLLFAYDGTLKKFNFNNLNLKLGDLRIILPALPVKLHGLVQGDLSYQNVYNGSLTLVNLGYDGKNRYISDINETIIIKDNLFKKENIKLKFLGNPCTASIACTDPSLDKIFLHVNSPRIVIPKGQETTGVGSSTNKPLSTSTTITGRIDIKEFSYDNITFHNSSLNYMFSGNKIVINKITSNYDDGNILGNGYVMFESKAPRAFTNVQFNNVKVQNIVNLSDNFKNRFFGIAQGKANLKFDLKGDVLKKIFGLIEFKIDGGKLVNTGIQNALGILLAPIKHKLQDLEFKTIYGNFSINGVHTNVNSFIFNGHDVRLSLKGAANQNLSGKLNIFLEFNEHFVEEYGPLEKAPFTKYKKGEWYTIPVLQKGDITNSKNYKQLEPQ